MNWHALLATIQQLSFLIISGVGIVIWYYWQRWQKRQDEQARMREMKATAYRIRHEKSLALIGFKIEAMKSGITASLNGQAKVFTDSYDKKMESQLQEFELTDSDFK